MRREKFKVAWACRESVYNRFMAQLATEADIRRYAEGLYATAAAAPPRLFDRSWWTGRLLECAIRDEAFKIQLFRFSHVLPALQNQTHIKAHAEHHFRAPVLPASRT